MTCIVGLKYKGEVWMGSDSLATADWSATMRRDPKVFTNGPMVIGYCGSPRMGQLLAHALVIPEQLPSKADFPWLVVDFIDAVRGVFREKAWGEKKDGQESGGDFMFGYRGELYHVASDFQVVHMVDNFHAIGCGGEQARGAMFATRRKPEERLRIALKAAERFNAGVRGPFHIIRGGRRP